MIDQANNAPLNFDDVVAALSDTDPNQTNASKLRTQIGRGSLATIQKHLDTIRVQRIQASQSDALPVPPAPPELLAMWGVAVAVATAQVRTRLDAVVRERDVANLRCGALEQDRKSLEEEVTNLADSLVNIESQYSVAAEKSVADAKSVVDQLDATKAAASKNEARLISELSAATAQIKFIELQSQNSSQAMQVTIDRLTDQIGELKSLLHTAAARPA